MTCTCAYHDQLIEIRRHLHTMPEEGWSEFTTTAFIVGKLRDNSYTIEATVPPFAMLAMPSGGQTIRCSAEIAPSSPARTA